MSHLAERFAEAVQTLVGDGPVKQRLIRAFGEHLGDLNGADLPPALRAGFSELQNALSRRVPAGTESRVQASVQKMSAAEAGDCAGTIVELYAALLGQLERAEPLKVVSSSRKTSRATRQPHIIRAPHWRAAGAPFATSINVPRGPYAHHPPTPSSTSCVNARVLRSSVPARRASRVR